MKRLPILIIFALIPLFFQAQTVLIPQIGFNTSITSNNPSDLTSFVRPGWQLGLDARFGKIVHIVPGIHFFSTGTLLDVPIPGSPGDFETENISVSAIKVPIKLGVNVIPLGSLFRLRLQGGPIWSFNLGVGKNDSNITNDDIKNTNLGILLGGGIDVLFLFLDINYEIGTSQFYENTPESNINVFTVSAGIKIKTSKNKKK